VSEGVTDRELATIMMESGCDDAINLDGGGSSVMLLSDAGGSEPVGPRVVNSPSGGRPRPLPVLLGIRRK
jgi:exopolysaccharide biosynthesis protein